MFTLIFVLLMNFATWSGHSLHFSDNSAVMHTGSNVNNIKIHLVKINVSHVGKLPSNVAYKIATGAAPMRVKRWSVPQTCRSVLTLGVHYCDLYQMS